MIVKCVRYIYNMYDYPSLHAPFHSKWPQGFLSRINMIIPFLTGIWRKKLSVWKPEHFNLRHDKLYKIQIKTLIMTSMKKKTYSDTIHSNLPTLWFYCLNLNIIIAEIPRLNLNNVREKYATFARTPDRKYLSSRTKACNNKIYTPPRNVIWVSMEKVCCSKPLWQQWVAI